MSEILAHLPEEVIEAVEGAGVEESVSGLPEDSGHLVVVVGHQLGLGGLLRESKEPVDVLHSLEGILTQERNKQDQRHILNPLHWGHDAAGSSSRV